MNELRIGDGCSFMSWVGVSSNNPFISSYWMNIGFEIDVHPWVEAEYLVLISILLKLFNIWMLGWDRYSSMSWGGIPSSNPMR